MKAIMAMGIFAAMSATVNSACAGSLTQSNEKARLEVEFGAPTWKQVLHYKKLYSAKPFPDAIIYYYDNGIYKILSQGENHYGLYVLQGDFQGQTYTVRYISLPSIDWGDKTAFHQLTFIQGDRDNVFIQNAITDTGDAIAQQNGTFTLEKNDIANPIEEKWRSSRQ